MLTPVLNKLMERELPEVISAYKKLIGQDVFITSIHTPLIRLLLPILISASHDNREVHDVLVPSYKPSSTSQIKAAVFDETFYEFLVSIVRGLSIKESPAGRYKFNKVRCELLKLPKQKVLVFRANFTFSELLRIAASNLSLMRPAKIPNIIFEAQHNFKLPEISIDVSRHYANIIHSLTPTNLCENLKRNLEILRETDVFFSHIYSNSAYIDNDIFKLICHLCSNKGGEIIIGQHGGGWNIVKILNERQMISDFATSVKYWTYNFSTNQDRLKNRVNVRLPRFRPAKLNHTKVVFIEYAWPKHRVQLFSGPQEEEVSAMYMENAEFFRTSSINVEVALYPQFNQVFRQTFYRNYTGDNIRFKPLEKPLETLISQSNLMVVSILNTVFYQALINNYPVVIWFAPGVEIDSSFNELFEELEKCSIFHGSVVSCSNFVNEVNVTEWWSSKIVQANVRRLRYALLGC